MSKASTLLLLKENKFNIPDFIPVKDTNYRLPFKSREYIIRSSFNLEDSKNSFAGMFRSYGPIKEKEIDFYLRKVLGYTKTAKRYVKKAKINMGLKPGAIIQRFVPHKTGGVCFTNYNGNILIASGNRASEVTSGTGRSKNFAVSRSLLNLETMPHYAKILAADALDIEALFKKPQDIEWLSDKKDIYIIQSRAAKKTGTGKWSDLHEFMSIVPNNAWSRYLAFSFLNSAEFRRISYAIFEDTISLKIFDWRKIMKKAYAKPKNKDPLEAFKEAVINYGYYGLLNQLSKDDSIALKRLNLSINRLGMSQDMLYSYFLKRRRSLYSKIIAKPKRYKEIFTKNTANNTGLSVKILKKPGLDNMTNREKLILDFSTMLLDIKNNSILYHDYKIAPQLRQYYVNLPKHIKKEKFTDYIEIFESQGHTIPAIRRKKQIERPTYVIKAPIEGLAYKDILIFKEVPPETVLKLKNVKCILSEEGGILSHAAILAREFNIPFIAGIPNLTKLFGRGEKLRITADNNCVTIKSVYKNTELTV